MRTQRYIHTHNHLDNSAFVKLGKLHSLKMQHLMIEPDIKKTCGIGGRYILKIEYLPWKIQIQIKEFFFKEKPTTNYCL